MVEPQLLAQSLRGQVWRTLLPAIPMLVVLIGLSRITGQWTWGETTLLAVGCGLLLYRFVAWRRCGDLWDDGVSLQVRRAGAVLDSVEWRELSGVHFWYLKSAPLEWHSAKFNPTLPRVTVIRRGESPVLEVGHRVPRFADLYLPTRASRSRADQALQHACIRHGIKLRSPGSRTLKKIDWSTVTESGTRKG